MQFNVLQNNCKTQIIHKYRDLMRELHILYAFVSKCGINYMHWIQYQSIHTNRNVDIKVCN